MMKLFKVVSYDGRFGGVYSSCVVIAEDETRALELATDAHYKPESVDDLLSVEVLCEDTAKEYVGEEIPANEL